MYGLCRVLKATIHIRENVSSVFSIEIEPFSFVYQYFAIIDIE